VIRNAEYMLKFIKHGVLTQDTDVAAQHSSHLLHDRGLLLSCLCLNGVCDSLLCL
jgi:hypothetical protein